MISVELSYIAKTLDWRLVGQDKPIENLCTDSRQVKAGDCFIALYGDNFDAHDFIEQVINAGAMSLIVSKEQSNCPVPQLVVEDTLSSEELKQLESLAELGNIELDHDLLKKTINTCRLTSARKKIQQKYLSVLKNYDETKENVEGVCEIPLMADEVTGSDAIYNFAKLLLKDQSDMSTEQFITHVPTIGDMVKIAGLKMNEQLNGINGTVVSAIDTSTGRCGVSIEVDGSKRLLSLHPKNIAMVQRSQSLKDEKDQDTKLNEPKMTTQSMNSKTKETNTKNDTISDGIMSKAISILNDPEIKEMIDQEPLVKAAIADCLNNPMNFMKYLADPKLSPFITKAMSKF